MNCFFDRERMMTVYCGVEEPRCVRLAAQDLCGDLRKLSGREAALCDRAPAAQTEDALLVATLGTAAAELPGMKNGNDLPRGRAFRQRQYCAECAGLRAGAGGKPDGIHV